MAGINFGKRLYRLLILGFQATTTTALHLADTWMTNANSRPIEIGCFEADKYSGQGW